MVLLDSVVEVFNLANQDLYGTDSADCIDRRLVVSKCKLPTRGSKGVFP
jgi:hypothetical protein